MLTLIIGGARSGKSRFAVYLCPPESAVTYIATARPSDDGEMQARIARHRRERPSHWKTIEAPASLASAIADQKSASDIVLVDCLTLWLGNLFWEHRNASPENLEDLERIASHEIDAVAKASTGGRVILVTNEVGCSLVPDSPLGRFFQDLQGFVNQSAARHADVVYQLTAGIPLMLKPRL